MNAPTPTPADPTPTKSTKAIGAAVSALVTDVLICLSDGKITGDEWGSIAGAVTIVALTVWSLRNKPKGR